MKIGINASYAVSENPTGIGNYIINLVQALSTFDKKNQYFLYYRWKIKKEKYLPLGLPSVRFEPHFTFLSPNKLDVFHDPSFKTIKIGKSKNIVTVHDIVVALKEDYTSEKFKKHQYPKLLKTVNKTDRIIAVSEFTKNQLIKYFSVKPDKISVTHLGVDSRIFIPGKKNNDFLKKYNLPGQYLLYVGNIEKRKNLINMIKSFEKIIKKNKDVFLILIGKNGYGGEEIRNFIRQSFSSKNIIQLDYISNVDLVYFYQNAELFLFPSFYEGFGLPVLESMACGCPVITSNESAIPEAGGDSVLYADPYNSDDIAEKTLHLLKNTKLKNELTAKALSSINNFSWEKTAEKTLNVYNEVFND